MAFKATHVGEHTSEVERREPTVHDYRVYKDGEETPYTIHMQWEWAGASGVWVCEMREDGERIDAPAHLRDLIEPPNAGTGNRMEGRVR